MNFFFVSKLWGQKTIKEEKIQKEKKSDSNIQRIKKKHNKSTVGIYFSS